ncbi:MAG: helix-turn-helix domain-containing protein [Lachnospiraceae bacterium]
MELTQKEFDLLRLFLKNSGRVLPGRIFWIRSGVSDYFGDERIVDTHIKNLRKKLGNQLIETVRGVGYRLEKIKK